MKSSRNLLVSFLILLAIGVSMPSAAVAQDRANNLIQGGHSGTWFDPTEPGHGLFVEVLNSSASPTGKVVVASWFAFIDGNRTWLLGSGSVIKVDGGYKAVLDVYIYSGNDFPPFYNQSLSSQRYWGTIELSFTGCDFMYLKWDSVITGYGSGDLDMRRLSTIADSECIPDLSGEPKDDDHGDTYSQGTYLTDISNKTKKISGRLEKKGDVDVFVFTLIEGRNVSLFTLGPTSTDTVGTLYEVVGGTEEEVVESDTSPSDNGFNIQENLSKGTYTLHVTGKGDVETGDYDLYYNAQ